MVVMGVSSGKMYWGCSIIVIGANSVQIIDINGSNQFGEGVLYILVPPG